MKTCKLLVVLLLTTGCGQSPTDYVIDKVVKEKDPRTISGIEPLLKKHVDSWQKEFGNTGDIPIQFADSLPDDKAGICFTWRGMKTYREIKILRPYYDRVMKIASNWPSVANSMVEQLVYHELGHCHLDQDHRDDHENGKPESIMRSWAFNAQEITKYYWSYRPGYIDELRNGGE